MKNFHRKHIRMVKRLHPKHIIRLYKMNRLWGDGIFEAAYYALRGKAFVAVVGTNE